MSRKDQGSLFPYIPSDKMFRTSEKYKEVCTNSPKPSECFFMASAAELAFIRCFARQRLKVSINMANKPSKTKFRQLKLWHFLKNWERFWYRFWYRLYRFWICRGNYTRCLLGRGQPRDFLEKEEARRKRSSERCWRVVSKQGGKPGRFWNSEREWKSVGIYPSPDEKISRASVLLYVPDVQSWKDSLRAGSRWPLGTRTLTLCSWNCCGRLLLYVDVYVRWSSLRLS